MAHSTQIVKINVNLLCRSDAISVSIAFGPIWRFERSLSMFLKNVIRGSSKVLIEISSCQSCHEEPCNVQHAIVMIFRGMRKMQR